MDEMGAFILSIPNVDRCSNQEVEEWLNKYKKNHSVFDGVFSIARLSCGKVKGEHIASIQTAMKLWTGLGISVSPKLHAIEDHMAKQLKNFLGIGDFCEDFIEKTHQDGISHGLIIP